MKYLGMILMSIVSLAIMIGAVMYLSNRFAIYFPSLSNKSWLWIIGSVTFIMMFGQAFSVTPNAMGRIIAMFGSLATGVILYLLLSVIALELINLIYHISPNLRGIVSLALTTVCFGIGIFNQVCPK